MGENAGDLHALLSGCLSIHFHSTPTLLSVAKVHEPLRGAFENTRVYLSMIGCLIPSRQTTHF